MDYRQLIGNGVIAVSGYVGSKAVAFASATPAYTTQFSEPYSIVGIALPNWLGFVFFFVSLVFGTLVGATQESPVDKYFKRPWIKPVYSFGFGVLIAVFVLPIFYPDITIWSLIAPVAFFASIGGVVVYYLVSIFTKPELWRLIEDAVKNKVRNYLDKGGKK